MTSKRIYFDLDDTLVNTRETIFKRIKILSTKYLLDINPLFIYSLLDNPERQKLLTPDAQLATNFWRDYELLRKSIFANAIPGARETLEFLIFRGDKIGIITNNTYSKSLKKLSHARIDPQLFQNNIHSCSELGALKPSSDIVAYLNPDSGSFVYVGNDQLDYNFAKNAGAYFYAVCTGEAKSEDFLKLGLAKERIFPSVREVFQ